MENTFRIFLNKNEKIIGTIATVLGVIMFFSLLEVLFSNLKGNSNIIIQPAATAVNGLFWSLYAYGRKDWFLLIPNTLAFVLGILITLSAVV